jgi:hypothetical protein
MKFSLLIRAWKFRKILEELSRRLSKISLFRNINGISTST